MHVCGPFIPAVPPGMLAAAAGLSVRTRGPAEIRGGPNNRRVIPRGALRPSRRAARAAPTAVAGHGGGRWARRRRRGAAAARAHRPTSHDHRVYFSITI